MLREIEIVALVFSLVMALTACSPSDSQPALTQVSGNAVAWDRSNDPGRMFSGYESRLDRLAKSGRAEIKPWSDTYWPSREGGAAYRWQSAGGGKELTDPHYYRPHDSYALAEMSDESLAKLSPAEKYDIIQGRFDYPTVRKEASRTSPEMPKWHGLCHAVAIATTNFAEPRTVHYRVQLGNGRTREIPLFSSDTKALLAMAVDDVMRGSEEWMLGERCESNAITSSGECWDTNPASFYILVTNVIGDLKQPMIYDVDSTSEVWNASAWSYTSTVTPKAGLSPRAAKGTVREVRVELDIQHTIGAQPSRNPNGGKFKAQRYSFTLEIDASGAVIGGEWVSKTRPDFVWLSRLPRTFGGYYSTLESVLERVQ